MEGMKVNCNIWACNFLPISPHEYFLINFSSWKLFCTFNNLTLCYKFVISEKLKRLEVLKLRKTFKFTKRLLRRTFAMLNFVGSGFINSYNINVLFTIVVIKKLSINTQSFMFLSTFPPLSNAIKIAVECLRKQRHSNDTRMTLNRNWSAYK